LSSSDAPIRGKDIGNAFDTPWTGSNSNLKLCAEPWIDPTAIVRDSALGAWTMVGPGATVMESSLGDYSYLMEESSITYAAVGKFCNIASHACINPGNHPLWRASLHHFTYRSKSYGLAEEDDHAFFRWRRAHRVVLGHDVWIGHGAVVLPGVKIGTGAAVGAGAVVSRDVEAYTVVAGVPAEPLRRRFDQETIEAMMRIAWWDWSHDELKASLEDFRRLSGEEFARKYDTDR
jgi:phosphonate metabolism protein (transferase hexapeptide repeat family)